MQTASPIALMGEAGSSRARELLGVVSHTRKPPTDNEAEGARKEEETAAMHDWNVMICRRHVNRLELDGASSLRLHVLSLLLTNGAAPAPTMS